MAGRRPRSWAEIHRRVLEEDYYDLPELERRRRLARQMKRGVWVVPAVLLTLAPSLIRDDVSTLLLIALGLCLYGGVSLYVLGRSWERRWDDLIREKRGA